MKAKREQFICNFCWIILLMQLELFRHHMFSKHWVYMIFLYAVFLSQIFVISTASFLFIVLFIISIMVCIFCIHTND